MRRISVIIPLLALLVMSACNQRDSTGPKEEIETKGGAGPQYIIRSGTSFGMCAGYCWSELRLDSTDALFTKKQMGRGMPDSSKYPEVNLPGKITVQEWNDLVAAVDMNAFNALDSIIGCPDCADGGSEWVSIESKGTVRKVTFENGAKIAPIDALVTKLRTIRATFTK